MWVFEMKVSEVYNSRLVPLFDKCFDYAKSTVIEARDPGVVRILVQNKPKQELERSLRAPTMCLTALTRRHKAVAEDQTR